MQYIVAIQLDGFYVRALNLEGVAVVMHEDRVLDATPAALSLGVCLEMGLAEVRAVLDGRGEIRPMEPTAVESAQESWLDALTVYSDVIEPLAPHRALVDMSAHPRPGELLERLGKRVERRSGCPVRMGVARSRHLAQKVLALGDPEGLALFCPEMLVSRWPTEWMAEIPLAHRDRLVALGYRKMGEVAELPLPMLQKLFGSEAYAIHLASRGLGDAHVRAEFPRDALASHLRFEGAPEDWQTFELGMRKVCQTLGAALQERHLAGLQLEVILEFEDGGFRQISRRFTKPIADVRTVFCAAKLLLNRFPEQPVVCLRLRAPGLSQAKHAQLGFDGLKSKQERERNAQVVVQSLCQVFGDKAIEVASQKPVSRRKQVLSAWQEVYGWR